MQAEDSSLESPPRRTKSLTEIYETCNLTIMKPESFEVASKTEVWKKAMEEEIKMIEKHEDMGISRLSARKNKSSALSRSTRQRLTLMA